MKVLLVFSAAAFLVLNCGIFEPERGTANLVIRVRESEPAGLLKAAGMLDSMRVEVILNGENVYDETVERDDDDKLRCEIKDIKSGSGYSVVLTGFEGRQAVIWASETNITLRGGRTEKVDLEWGTTAVIYGTMSGNDGKSYKTVRIGGQWWIAENLKETVYRNGDPITSIESTAEWTDLSTGARCSYDGDQAKSNIYGYLYNGYAAADNRNIAPEGWRVPKQIDWMILETYLGGNQQAGGKMKTANEHWNRPNEGAANESGFSALPGGLRAENGEFGFEKSRAFFHFHSPQRQAKELRFDDSQIRTIPVHARSGLSVRLVREE